VAEQALHYSIPQAERFRAELVPLQAIEPILETRSSVALNDARPLRMDWARDYPESVTTGIREQGAKVRIPVTEEAQKMWQSPNTP